MVNRKTLFAVPKPVGALTVILYIMINKSVNLLMGGLTLFAAQGCKAPKQVAEQADEDSLVEAVVFMDQMQIHKGRPENETGRTETEIHVSIPPT